MVLLYCLRVVLCATSTYSIIQWYKPINWKSIGPTFPDEIKIEIAKCETIEIGKGRKLKDLCNEQALKDIEASISLVSSAGKVGVVGYCWGGSLAWRIADQSNELSGCVSYYGGDIPKLKHCNPKCNFLSHFGELDQSIPIEDVKSFKQFKPEVEIFT